MLEAIVTKTSKAYHKLLRHTMLKSVNFRYLEKLNAYIAIINSDFFH